MDKCCVSPVNAGSGNVAGAPKKPSPGTWNGEPGYAKRTMGPNSAPEKTYEDAMPDSLPRKDRGSTFVTTPAKPPFGDKK